MFHRVKSETNQEQDNQDTQDDQQAPAQAEIKEFRKPVQEETAEQAPAQEKPTQTPEKDTKIMNQQPQDTAGEDRSEDRSERTIPASPYQQTQAATRGGYAAGGYPGSSSYAARPASSDSAAGDRRLTIGPGITMSGEIEHCDHLVVEGTLEAALKGANIVEIAESGVFYGTVEIDEATVAGRFEGDLTVSGRLTIRAGGRVTGSIAYGELEIEAGAVIDGRITPISALEGSKDKSAPSSTAKSREAAKAPKAEQRPSPANTDGELFMEKAAAE